MITYFIGLIIVGISVGYLHGIPYGGLAIGGGLLAQAITVGFFKSIRRM